VRGARATLVVTRSARDRTKSEVKIYASVKYRFYRKYYEYFRKEYYCKWFLYYCGLLFSWVWLTI